MRNFAVQLVVLTSCFASASPADAATRVFVAAQGSDANPCTFAAPCRTFQHAHDVVAASGEINVLDPAGYGALTITKAISIQGHDFSGISVPSDGIGIVINAGPGDIVDLRGLIIEGAKIGGNGIRFNSGLSLTVENCIIRNHSGDGFDFITNGSSSLTLSNTKVADNGGNGIYIQFQGSSVASIGTAVLNRVESYNNGAHGIGIATIPSAGVMYVAVADSVVSKNGLAGILADASGADTIVSFFRSVSSHNDTGVAGVNLAQMHVSRSLIFHNKTGWNHAYSYGDHVSHHNQANTNPTLTFPLQ